MKKLIYVVCGLNASRSQVIEEFLKNKYANTPKIEIKSAGLDVYPIGERDKRTSFTRELAEQADIIFASDHDKFYKIRYELLKNDEEQLKKVHLLRIPDIFHTHKNAFFGGNLDEYVNYMETINQQEGYSDLRKYISYLTPKAASALTEAFYVRELYSAHQSPELRQDKKYPLQLLNKTLEFRFPWMAKLIENNKK